MTLENLQQTIDYHFHDPALLEQVFIHRSYLNEAKNKTLEHNERLEFLGDAVLELVVTEHLFLTSTEPEGVLTSWRAALVRGEQLGKIAGELQLNKLLQLSKGEKASAGKAKSLMLANTLEALIGAIYLDGGLSAATNFVHRQVIIHLGTILEHQLHLDPKSQLQEQLQVEKGITPSYIIISEKGPDHNKVFKAAVMIGQRRLATGEGVSKQRAETAAARAALSKLNATQSLVEQSQTVSGQPRPKR